MIVLFREGTSQVYNGITCEYRLVNEFGFEGMLKNGWVLNPKDLYKETPEETSEENSKKASKEASKETRKEKDVEDHAKSKVTIIRKPEVSAKGLVASKSNVTTPKLASSIPKK